ncbi:hypothetical protein ACOME3_006803 [Neoechinorhynchus agilis]
MYLHSGSSEIREGHMANSVQRSGSWFTDDCNHWLQYLSLHANSSDEEKGRKNIERKSETVHSESYFNFNVSPSGNNSLCDNPTDFRFNNKKKQLYCPSSLDVY